MSCQVYSTDQTYPITNSSDLNPFPHRLAACRHSTATEINKNGQQVLSSLNCLKEAKIIQVIRCWNHLHPEQRQSQIPTLHTSQDLALNIIRTSWKIVETSWIKDSSPLPGSDQAIGSYLFRVFRQLEAETPKRQTLTAPHVTLLQHMQQTSLFPW